MKNIIKIIVLLLIFVIADMASYAQRTMSLRQFETELQAYRNHPNPKAAGLDDGKDITYVKDVSNELDQFVGAWKGNYNSRSYEVTFVKRIAYKTDLDDEMSWDLLKGWVTVKDSVGNTIYTNTNLPERSNKFTGSNFPDSSNMYRMIFTGNCYNESGDVFIRIESNGQLSLTFVVLPDIQGNDCPNGFTPVLPIAPNEVLLTKQP